jgi:TctA family transporter
VGATAWLSELIDVKENLALLLALFILSIAAAALAACLLRKHAARLASVDWSILNPILAAYLVSITLAIDGPAGFAVLCVGCGIGWLCLRSGVERTCLMGSIILPTLLLLFRVF